MRLRMDVSRILDVFTIFEETYPVLCTDEGFAFHIFAWCANELWNQDGRMAGSVILLALRVRYKLIPTSRGQDVEQVSYLGRKYERKCERATGLRGLILIVAKNIPCACLGQIAQGAREMEREGSCDGCLKLFPRDQLKVCSRCKDCQYCSTECQHNHW